MKQVLVIVWVLLGLHSYAQDFYLKNPDKAKLFPIHHGTFKKYAYVLDGKISSAKSLVNHPETKLYRIFPYQISLEGHPFKGAIYFHTADYPIPASRYENDPAFFINGIQVSPYEPRKTNPFFYRRIDKSVTDTVINGMSYKGSIHISTDEDFFAGRLNLQDLLKQYPYMPADRILFHWRGPNYIHEGEDRLGTVIDKNFPLYYIKPANLRAVEVDRIRLAGGDRYVLHLMDQDYLRNRQKTTQLFAEPLALDPLCPCYLCQHDTSGITVFNHLELEPRPINTIRGYLGKLSEILGLPIADIQPTGSTDSLTVEFIVTKDGMLTGLHSTDALKPGQDDLLTAIKRNSCAWSIATSNGRPLYFRRKMTLYYTAAEKGRIRSLDDLKFRYE